MSKSKLMGCASYVFTPAMLVCHYLTGHTAFLFFLGLLNGLAAAFIGMSMIIMFSALTSDKTGKIATAVVELARAVHFELSALRRIYTILLWVTLIGYLTYVESYVTLTFSLIAILIVAVFYGFLRKVYNDFTKLTATDDNARNLEEYNEGQGTKAR